MEKQDIHPVVLPEHLLDLPHSKQQDRLAPREWMLLAGEDYAAHFTKSPRIYVQLSLLLLGE